MMMTKAKDLVTILIVGSGEPEIVEIPQQLGRAMIAKILVANTAEGLIDFARKHNPTVVLFGPSMLNYEGAYLPDVVKSVYPQANVIVLHQADLKGSEA